MGQETATVYKLSTGNQLVSNKTEKTADEKTQYTVTIKETVYPVYHTSRDKYYILRTSKKTGKEYKQYINVEL